LILGIIGVLHLELHKEVVRREKYPVKKRGGGLFREMVVLWIPLH